MAEVSTYEIVADNVCLTASLTGDRNSYTKGTTIGARRITSW